MALTGASVAASGLGLHVSPLADIAGGASFATVAGCSSESLGEIPLRTGGESLLDRA